MGLSNPLKRESAVLRSAKTKSPDVQMALKHCMLVPISRKGSLETVYVRPITEKQNFETKEYITPKTLTGRVLRLAELPACALCQVYSFA